MGESALKVSFEVLTCFRYIVFLPKDKFVGQSIKLYGEYGEGMIDIFRCFVTEGDHILDVGANIGAFTVPLAQFVGQSAGRVYAFEWQRPVFQMLNANVMINNLANVVTYHTAVGDTNEGYFLQNPFKSQYMVNHVLPGNVKAEHTQWAKDTIRVSRMAIDSLELPCEVLQGLPEHRAPSSTQPTLSFVKISVVGQESQVIHGLLDTLDRCKPVVYFQQGHTDREIRTLLEPLGYRWWFVHVSSLFNPNNFFGVNENKLMVSVPMVIAAPFDISVDYIQTFGRGRPNWSVREYALESTPQRNDN